tara:strand:- start:5066 stop:5290 length:225 start_codon:yes stop_codon:yes gene_type:complete
MTTTRKLTEFEVEQIEHRLATHLQDLKELRDFIKHPQIKRDFRLAAMPKIQALESELKAAMDWGVVVPAVREDA